MKAPKRQNALPAAIDIELATPREIKYFSNVYFNVIGAYQETRQQIMPVGSVETSYLDK